jgi:CRISPR/Cas system-associated protein Cas10 (large subunit of type III CRISPR-Cas system)
MDDIKKLAKQLQKMSKVLEMQAAPKLRPAPPAPGTAVDRDPKKIAKQEHTCPKCGLTALIGEEFGLRTDQYGRAKFQSWCRACRNSKDSHPSRHGLPRTYRSR